MLTLLSSRSARGGWRPLLLLLLPLVLLLVTAWGGLQVAWEGV
jgi:hypothetical protein